MGIGDLFSIFAGGAWLATETAKEIGERAVGEERSRLIKAYIAEHTDPELEQRMMEDVKNPDMYDAVWERIESFKRDNPVSAMRKPRSLSSRSTMVLMVIPVVLAGRMSVRRDSHSVPQTEAYMGKANIRIWNWTGTVILQSCF